MNPIPPAPQPEWHHLRKLPPEFYRGFAAVQWTITFHHRAVGQASRLSPISMQTSDRENGRGAKRPRPGGCEILGACLKTHVPSTTKLEASLTSTLEACATGVAQAACLLVPAASCRPLRLFKHALTDGDRRDACPTLRAARLPSGVELDLQKQPHGSVLREQDRTRGALTKACFYLLDNPRKAGLVAHPRDGPHLGAVVPGYPFLHPLEEGFWEILWRFYQEQREPMPVEPVEDGGGRQTAATSP